MAKKNNIKNTNAKKPKTKTKLNKKNLAKIIVSLVLVLILSVSAVFAYGVYKDTENFSASKLLSGEASKIYDVDGNLMYTYGSDENGARQNITYEDLPQVLIDAIVAAEDSRYFEHNGFDLPRIAKAAISNLVSHSRQGGSTITQQVIKKSYFPKEQRTYTRKLSEVILAIQADKELSKEEIISLYLNKIYFGRSTKSIGISAASKYYFNKDVSDLTLPEASLLAGTLNSPNNYDPYYNLSAATNRRNTILNLMVTHGYITQQECDDAKKVKIENMLDRSGVSSNSGYLAAYIDMVTKEVKKRTGYNPTDTQMNIYTYCKADIQQAAADLNNGTTYDYSDEDMNMSGAVQETLSGRVVAVLGGRNYQTGNLNLATTKQQPGSSVKPFLDYGVAFEYLDWCTGHTVDDTPWDASASYKPKNWDGNFHGKVLLSSALEQSWNVPAVRTYMEVAKKVGDDDITKQMESVGIDMSGESVNTSYAIGGWEKGISPVEMCNVYGTIANNGKNTESHTINYCEIVSTGEKFNIDEDIQKAAKQSMYSTASAFMIRETMLDYTKNGSGNYGYLSGLSNIAGKTGTSNFSNSKYVRDGKSKDIWMTAYNPDYVCSVWMGFTVEGIKKGKNTSDYSAKPAIVVEKLMKLLTHDGIKNKFPDQPDDVVQASIVKGIYPYQSPSSSTPSSNTITAWFKKGTTPTSTAKEYGINNLSSFDASLTNGKITFTFAAYNPIEATTNENYNEATQSYGKVIYVVDVLDAATEKVLATEKFSSNTGTLSYTPTGQVKVVGYYSYENQTGKTSNKISKSVGEVALKDITASMSANGTALNDGGSTTATSVSVKISLQNSSNTCSMVLYSNDNTQLGSSASSSATFSNLTEGTYHVTVTEKNSSGKSVEKTLHFTIEKAQ